MRQGILSGELALSVRARYKFPSPYLGLLESRLYVQSLQK